MSHLCEWLHIQLESLPRIQYPFDVNSLPLNGIYFFYEDGEFCSHNDVPMRIVRIGTQKDGRFRKRIDSHFILGKDKIRFNANQAAPKDRSIFRKNIGRALLQKTNDSAYLPVWDIKFTNKYERQKYGHLRDIEKEQSLENEISDIIKSKFSFRFIEVANQYMVEDSLEHALIGTVAKCKFCRPSQVWLGNFSPEAKIRTSGLWLFQHLNDQPISASHQQAIEIAIQQTLKHYFY